MKRNDKNKVSPENVVLVMFYANNRQCNLINNRKIKMVEFHLIRFTVFERSLSINYRYL